MLQAMLEKLKAGGGAGGMPGMGGGGGAGGQPDLGNMQVHPIYAAASLSDRSSAIRLQARTTVQVGTAVRALSLTRAMDYC